MYILISWWSPAKDIEKAADFPHMEYRENMEKYGDHSFNVLNNNSQKKK